MAVTAGGCTMLPSTSSPTGVPVASLVTASPTALPAHPATVVPAALETGTPGSPIQGYMISGSILSGGDTSPTGLLDAPRKFLYSVQTDDGQSVSLTYTAYPPSPNPAGKKIKLNFHAGSILIGDYVRAHGSYDENTRTLVVAEEGDYIETFASKP